MSWTARAKAGMRRLLGDRLATWVHAARFWILLHRGGATEVELALVPLFLRKGDVAVDVGANGADWTLALSRAVGPAGEVMAFEADPYYAEVTRKTLHLLRLKNVTFFPFGLSDADEDAHLAVCEGKERVSGRGRVIRQVDERRVEAGQVVPVRLVRLDGLAERYPRIRDARFIKCDVEGFELMVFRGARDLLESARPVVVTEVGHAGSHGLRDEELFSFFEELGYLAYVVGSEPNALVRSRQAGDTPDGHRQNRVMLPRDKPSPHGLQIAAGGASMGSSIGTPPRDTRH